MLLKCFIILLFVSSSSTLSLNEFFPFGPEVDDLTIQPNDDESEGPLELPHVFPYFDNNHRRIWIANNGLFSFLSPIDQYVPDPFPLANDSRLVAGFWTDIDTRGNLNDTGNKVYYQVYSDMRLINSTLSVFHKTHNYVRSFFPQQRLFQPTMVIVATWYRVGAFSVQTAQLNTFQIVLSTDTDRSFVFFLYHNIQWVSPSNSNSGPYAQAGFNAGDGITFETLPYSNTEDIVQLVNKSNVNIPGLFAYRVDTDKIDSGGCNVNVTTAVFRPRMSSQFGSTALHIQGPCFTNETKVKCQFDSPPQIVDGFVIDDFQAVCLTPFASVHGRVPVSVSIDNGRTYSEAGVFTYAPFQFGSDQVTIEIEDGDNLLKIGQYVQLKWHFSEMARNSFPNSTKIDIELWNVKLRSLSQLQKDNLPIVLSQNLDLNDSARVQLPASISTISTCFIRVTARFESRTYAGLNTGLLLVRSPPNLVPELCEDWATQQPHPSVWNNDNLLLCPMTRIQATAAGRCCYRSDPQCFRGNPSPHNCWLHQARPGRNESSAVECYLSITSNRHGAGTECCYDMDGLIITRGTGAGTDNRYEPTMSPIKHFYEDTLPYLQCCVMSTNIDMCYKYMFFRPLRRGSNTRNENGGNWGDPHFGTLDGLSYTFNGYGEYTYLAISNAVLPSVASDSVNRSFVFMSQIRTVPLLPSNATVTKGFAARSAEGESISLTISRRENLVLRRGNESIEFEDNINTLYFSDLTITRLDGQNNSHFSFAWTIGITAEIKVIKMTSSSRQLVLNIAMSVAGIFRNRTYGLLGTYDGTPDNDLRSQNGTIIGRNASLEQIHKYFGVTWAVNPLQSLFYYESDQSAQYFQEQNRLFIPSFLDPTMENNATIRNLCQINITSLPSSWTVAERTCYYDLAVTADVTFARTSLQVANELSSIRKNQTNPPSFETSLPIHMDLKQAEQVDLIISASSEYPSHAVELSVLHQPEKSVFDTKTGVFKWTATTGEHYLSITARDAKTDLQAKHDIQFNVNGTSTLVVNSDIGRISPFNTLHYLLFTFLFIVLSYIPECFFI